MKNSLVLKCLAVLLCAASLLGILGGAAGALALAEGDLYNRTVDQMLEETYSRQADLLANQTALAYASRSLGGCPQDLTQRYHMPMDLRYGYRILDADGNVLEESRPELKDTAAVYTVPVSGQYMHLVSTETESQRRAAEAEKQMELLGRGLSGQNDTAIPAEGVSVNQVLFTDSMGNLIYEACGDDSSCTSTYNYYHGTQFYSSSNSHRAQGRIGFLFTGAEGQLLYHSFLEEWEEDFTACEVSGVMFLSHQDGFSFHAEDPDGLGTLVSERGYLRFVGYPAPVDSPTETAPAEAPETLPPETVPETVPPETAAETLPAETAPPEEPPAETEYREASVTEETVQNETVPSSASAPPTETVPGETAAAGDDIPLINGLPLDAYQINTTDFYDTATGEHTTAKYVYLTLPPMTAEIYLDHGSDRNIHLYDVLRLVRQFRQYLLPVIGICLLVFAVSFIYLCTAAGRRPKSAAVRAGGLNRLPLDFYLALDAGICAGLIALTGMAVPTLLGRDFLLGCSFALACLFGVCLMIVGILFAFVAQVKMPRGFWWRNLLTIRLCFLLKRMFLWTERTLRKKIFPFLGHLLVNLWRFTLAVLNRSRAIAKTLLGRTAALLGSFFRKTGRALHRWLSLMPVTWQWTITGMFQFCITLIAGTTHNELLTVVCMLGALALILYGSHCFGLLRESTQKMSQGNLDTKVDDSLMIGCFREFAGELNDLADVAMVAAQKQLKSERMKTELITNVSHDIKTPLTSIINYVDLLQKPHSPEEQRQYLDVLDRQSQRLKKLVEDLMEMSKASTGNMTVEITRLDAVESVNQALGEFSGKLERAQLYPVFRHSDAAMPILADGKLVWRVLSNLLGNAVKYAMPGTRIYLELSRVSGTVILSLKNISREELNIDAEELMERFVRGDASRNTDGSGLGLNIAKSLMELQQGQLQLLVDGDLFKVTLIFPEAD